SGSKYGLNIWWSRPGPPCNTISGKPLPSSSTLRLYPSGRVTSTRELYSEGCPSLRYGAQATVSGARERGRLTSPHRLVGDASAARSWSGALFRSSLVPMVLADDDRQYVAANAASCLLLRLPEDEVLKRRIDDVTPPET